MAAPSLLSLASGMTADLYRAAIGPRGQNYYIDHFTRFDAQGRTSATWHWPAYWNTLNWLIYRKMWGWALAYVGALVGAALLVFGVGKLMFAYSSTTGLMLFLLFLAAAFVVPGLYANAWYYAHCNERINEVLRNTPEVRDACSVLTQQASDRRGWAALVAGNVALWAVLGSLVAAFMRTPAAPDLQLARDDSAVEAASAATPTSTGGPFQAVAATVPAGVSPPALPVPPADLEADPPTAAPLPEERGPAWGITSPAKLETFVKAYEDVVVAQVDAVPPQTTPVTVPVATAAAALPAAPVQVAAEKLAEKTPEKATEVKSPVDKPVQAKPVARKADAQAVSGPTAPHSGKSWYVQAGAFAEQANADRVLARLQEAGVPARAEPVASRAGTLTRMLVGPFASKAEAERMVLRIKALELAAVVRRE